LQQPQSSPRRNKRLRNINRYPHLLSEFIMLFCDIYFIINVLIKFMADFSFCHHDLMVYLSGGLVFDVIFILSVHTWIYYMLLNIIEYLIWFIFFLSFQRDVNLNDDNLLGDIMAELSQAPSSSIMPPPIKLRKKTPKLVNNFDVFFSRSTLYL
jgi:hypothetical protein